MQCNNVNITIGSRPSVQCNNERRLDIIKSFFLFALENRKRVGIVLQQNILGASGQQYSAGIRAPDEGLRSPGPREGDDGGVKSTLLVFASPAPLADVASVDAGASPP